MDLGKLLRKRIRTTFRPYLEEQGFTEFSDLCAWRRGERRIDCVQVMTGAFERGTRIGWDGPREVRSNAATFSLEIGCYYTDIHLLPWINPLSERPRCPRGTRSRGPECHRLRSLARSYECENVQGTLCPSDDGSDLDRAVGDALQALSSRGLAWLETAHDIDAFLTRVGKSPSEYLEERGDPVEMSDAERVELEAWKSARGIGEDEAFMIYEANDPPAYLVRLQRAANFRDHTAMDSLPPYGDLLYGLLVGSGRTDEALATMRRDGDPAPDELRYAEMLAHGLSKRTVTAMRKRDVAYRNEIHDHLAMLEADFDRRVGA